MVALRDMHPCMESIIPDTVTDMMKSLLRATPDKQHRHNIEHTVVHRTQEYEERWYPACSWVCTTVTSVYQDIAKIEGFRQLQAYAHGKNNRGVQLSMQPPILTRISSDRTNGFERKFIVCTYLGRTEADGYPTPSSPNVYIEHLPDMTVFVKRFQGIACEEKWTHETKSFAELLKYKEDICTDFYITASYESPFQLVSDRNEIWFLKYDPKDNFSSKMDAQRGILRYGSHRIPMPAIVSWFIYLILAYISLLAGCLRTMFGVTYKLRDNWGSIQTRLRVMWLSIWYSVSVRTLLRSTMSMVLIGWGLIVALVTGHVETPSKTYRRSRVH